MNWNKFIGLARDSWAAVIPLTLLLLVGGYLVASRAEQSHFVGATTRLDRAIQDFRAGNGSAAIDLFTPLADSGNATAQYWLGEMYLYGSDVQPNASDAISLLTKSASQGYLPAELLLGQTYLNGFYTLQDFTQAKTWLMKAGLAGNPNAQRDLGEIYERGWGVKADPVEAYAWDAIAAARGNVLAQTERNRILKGLAGEDVTKAQARAKELDATINPLSELQMSAKKKS